MPGLFHPAVSFGLFSAAVSLLVAAIAWGQSDSNDARTYAVLMVLLSVWSSLYALQLLQSTVAEKQLLFSLRNFFSPLISVLFWVFTARYTDRQDLLSVRYLVPIVASGAAMAALPALNPAELFWTDMTLYTQGSFTRAKVTFAPLFWGFMAYVFIVVGGAHVYIVRELMDSFAVYRRQLGAMAIVGGVEFALVILFLSDHTGVVPSLNPWPYLQLVTYNMVFVAVPLGWSYFRESLFDLQPLTRQAVVEHMDDAVLVFDENDHLRHSNAHARRLLGLDPAVSATEGMPVEAVFGDQPELLDIYRGHREDTTPGDTTGSETPGLPELTDSLADGDAKTTVLESSDGDDPRYYDFRVSAIRSSTGDSIGTVVVARDVTVRRRQRELLKEQKRELERKNERLDQFVSTVSHDLRNPLAIAKGRLELARTEFESEHLAIVEDTHDRMGALIDDLLVLSRAGRTVEDPESVALAAVATEAWEYVDAVDCELVASIPAATSVTADRDRLLHVFENLYRNAAEHNDPPLTVRVGMIDDHDENQTTGFFIEDSGSAIPFSAPL
ncbi:MAG: histidine kinase N-terminal 7TM domain-containing protein [Halobacteriales archaeon]